MARRRYHVGRVKVDFSVVEKLAATARADTPLPVAKEVWELSRKSSIYRCKNGSYTLCLIWVSSAGYRLSSTHRGLRIANVLRSDAERT